MFMIMRNVVFKDEQLTYPVLPDNTILWEIQIVLLHCNCHDNNSISLSTLYTQLGLSESFCWLRHLRICYSWYQTSRNLSNLIVFSYWIHIASDSITVTHSNNTEALYYLVIHVNVISCLNHCSSQLVSINQVTLIPFDVSKIACWW